MAKATKKSPAKANGQITFRLGEEYAEVWTVLERHAAANGGSVNVAAREIVVAHVLSGGLNPAPAGGPGPEAAAAPAQPRDDDALLRTVRESHEGLRRDQAAGFRTLRGDIANLLRAVILKLEDMPVEEADRVVRTVLGPGDRAR